MTIPRLVLVLILAATVFGQAADSKDPIIIPVWPNGKMPGVGAKEAETELKRDDGFHRITNVSRPTLTLFRAPQKRAEAVPAVIVCPGGGYSYVVADKEGSEIAEWFNRSGITAFVLKYRVPDNRSGALQDLQRALSLIRARAKDWNLKPDQIGVIGFSAGGNLAAKASTHFAERTYPNIDEIDQRSCRPDFAVLVYPAYLDDKSGHVAPDLDLTANIPPTLIVHNEDDKTHVVGSKIYHAALDKANVTNEFKLYATGGHGYGLHCEKDARAWPEDTLKWLHKIGIH